MRVAKPTVHIVDDDPQVRESLDMLVGLAGLEARSYASAEEFLDTYRDNADLRPTCLLLDVRMPGMSGLQLQDKLAADGVKLPVIMMTAFGDVPMATRAMQAGALDFIQKPFNRQAVLDRIWEAILRDEHRIRKLGQQEETQQLLATLTAREREVMDQMIAGKSAKQTSSQFEISVKTVLKHRARVLEKLQVDSAVELVHLAYGCGLESGTSNSKPR